MKVISRASGNGSARMLYMQYAPTIIMSPCATLTILSSPKMSPRLKATSARPADTQTKSSRTWNDPLIVAMVPRGRRDLNPPQAGLAPPPYRGL